MEHGQATTNHVDEYGNPVAGHGVGTSMGAHSGVGTGAGAAHKTGGILQRSNSSSSSSSFEDDGMGGRRKKGIKEKIKEKLPYGHGDQQQTANTYGQQGHTGITSSSRAHGTTAIGGTYGWQGHTGMSGNETHGTDGTGEKKGIMDKIKEKPPGQH